MLFIRSFATLAVAAVAGSASAQTFTFATFADPSSGPVPAMFVYDGNAGTLDASWGQPGLKLETPGSAAPDVPNTTFVMTTLNQTGAGPFASFGSGTIRFFGPGNNLIFRIDFASAFLTGPIGFGGADLIGNNVVFSGPIVGPTPLSQESFSFSFANQVLTGNGFTATAAFTSSAAPTPGTLALIGVSGLVATRRRRA